MAKLKIGIIGGTGLEDPQILLHKQEKDVTTPFGPPSSPLTLGQINGVNVVILSRHGKKHELSPTDINYRANIFALKEEGCTHILSTNACGSLKENYKVGDLVILDQFIDMTTMREKSFHSSKSPLTNFKKVSHIPMGEPFCEETRKTMLTAVEKLGYSHHTDGTIVVIEGPRFSTRAESRMFGAWGGHVIGMTTVPEVCLAREVGLSYASVGMVTDYDSWKDQEHVTVEQVYSTLKKNSVKATELLIQTVGLIGEKDWSKVIEDNKNVSELSTC